MLLRGIRARYPWPMPYLRHPAPTGALLLALAATTTLTAPADGQIRRCTAADGGTVYTDRSCGSMGAVESRLRIDDGTAAGTPRYRGGCARRLDDLVFEVGAAIDAGDTNRLARSYHWTGLSTRSGYEVIDRLDAIAQRPLLDIAEVRPAPVVASTSVPAAWTVAGGTPPPPSPPPPREAAQPEGLRIEQTLADGVTPSSTTFGLRRHMDCWWITF